MSLADDWDKIPTPKEAKSLADDWDSIPTDTQPKEKGYVGRVVDAASKFNQSGSGPMDTLKAVGEVGLNAVTGASLGLLKHGIEEGAYLSGQSPEAAATTAQRVLPIDGYQPKTESGQALGELVGTAMSPLVEAGRWAAEKAGLSPAAQNIAGDFAPVVIPKIANAALSPVQTAKGIAAPIQAGLENAKAVPALAQDIASQGSMANMKARFGQLAEQGRTTTQPTTLTPQMLRGQEPIPETIKEVPKEAPKLTPENASPELKAVLDKTKNLNQEAVKRQLEADSLPVKMQLSPGQAANDIHKLSDEFNMRGTKEGQPLADLFNRQNTNLIDNVNAIRDRVAPKASGLDHVENGESLIGAYKTADKQLIEYINSKYQALRDAAGGDLPVDAKSLYSNVQGALKKELLTHDAPASQMNMLKDLADEGSMTYENFLALRKNLGNVARTATDGNTRTAAGIMIEQLERLPLRAEAQALQPLANEARSAAKARFDLMKKDPAYKAAIDGKVPPDKFVQKYIVNGNKADLQQMRENLAGDPIAHENISAAAINYLKSRAGIVNDNGNFSQAAYNKALEQLKPKLEYLFDPVAAQQIQTLGDVARYTQLQPKGSYFNNSNTLVSAAKGAAEGVLSNKTMGLYNVAKDAVTSGKRSKMAQEATKPGAGIKLKDIGKD